MGAAFDTRILSLALEALERGEVGSATAFVGPGSAYAAAWAARRGGPGRPMVTLAGPAPGSAPIMPGRTLLAFDRGCEAERSFHRACPGIACGALLLAGRRGAVRLRDAVTGTPADLAALLADGHGAVLPAGAALAMERAGGERLPDGTLRLETAYWWLPDGDSEGE